MRILTKHASFLALATGLGATLIGAPALAQTAPAAEAEEVVVVTGTRVAARSALDTPVAVDVVSAADLAKVGVTETGAALAVTIPSINFPRPGLADGTDTIRPATLRGLAPDQTLVLVNSKRRHPASLVNVNATIGRGSSATDLNTIPGGAIGSIEVLRDGASAQYGSDAISGVINIRLREASEGGAITLTYGERLTTTEVLVDPVPAGANWTVNDKRSVDRSDGRVINLGGWVGLPLTENGFVTVAGEILLQDRTIRSAPDWRVQYPLVNGQFDPREATFDRFNAWYGEPRIEQWTGFVNAGIDMGGGAELYGWFSVQMRDSTSAGFYRRANDARNIISIYPNGFLPLINPVVLDSSAAAGYRWTAGEWDLDASLVWGRNAMDFTIRNTLNRSLGPSSPTQFDAGGFGYNQWVLNASGVRTYDVGLASPLNVAVGAEVRRENYFIDAGAQESWVTGPFGGAGGAQVFPGFQPSNEVDVDRMAYSLWVDVEANLTDAFLVGAAIRAENYSDFGDALTGKLSARYDFTENFALRGSIQNGFRAPSLQQQFFTATSTNFINGVPFEIGTFPSTSRVGAALGGRPLEPEESVNLSLGAVARFGSFSLTVDAYRIDITNRIVLSENFTAGAAANDPVRLVLTANGITNSNGGRFFINGVETETSGVDVVANYRLITDTVGTFNLTFAANFNSTDVTRIPVNTVLPTLPVFARINELTFEQGTPADKFNATVDWSGGPFGVTLRAVRYGEVLSPATTATLDLVLQPEIVTDIEGRWNISDSLRVAVGSDNVFDVYPTKTPPNLNTTSNTPFSNYAPFGRSGRYVYARVTFSW